MNNSGVATGSSYGILSMYVYNLAVTGTSVLILLKAN